jgi:hypothetical protein
MQYMRISPYPKAVGYLRYANIGIGEQCPRNLKVILGQFRRSAAGTALFLSGGKPGATAFSQIRLRSNSAKALNI